MTSSLYDATERRPITLAELRDYVRDGGLFGARRQENGADCTYEVLQSVMRAGLLENVVPGLGGGSLPGLGGLGGLGALGALAGGGPLSALSGSGGLADLARLVGEHMARGGDRDDDDWDERRRRSSSRSSRGWSREDGDWSDGPERAGRRSGDRCWGKGERSDPPRRSHRSDEADWTSDPDFD